MSPKIRTAALARPSPRVPTQPAPHTPVPAAAAAGQEPISPAAAIWLDVFADAIVAMVLRETTTEEPHPVIAKNVPQDTRHE